MFYNNSTNIQHFSQLFSYNSQLWQQKWYRALSFYTLHVYHSTTYWKQWQHRMGYTILLGRQFTIRRNLFETSSVFCFSLLRNSNLLHFLFRKGRNIDKHHAVSKRFKQIQEGTFSEEFVEQCRSVDEINYRSKWNEKNMKWKLHVRMTQIAMQKSQKMSVSFFKNKKDFWLKTQNKDRKIMSEKQNIKSIHKSLRYTFEDEKILYDIMFNEMSYIRKSHRII